MATAAEKRWQRAQVVLKETFGFDELRPNQEHVVRPVLEGRDTLAVFATGGGKSLCFQLPAMVLPGITIVISPLIALMKDHVDKLRKLGVAALRLTSDLDRIPTSEALKEADILYISPEKARTAEFRKALRNVDVALIAVDEAHCISRFSDFRPAYAALQTILDDHEEAVRLAVTATADEQIVSDVVRILGLRNPVKFISSPWRENIAWEFHDGVGDGTLGRLLEKARDAEGSYIVYVSSRAEAERIADDFGMAYYHAGMQPELRTRVQQQFISGDVKGVAATTAFGMGIDKHDIRLVAVWQLPSSLFDLLQMVGRASRDNAPALGWVRTGGDAEKAQRFFIQASNPPWKTYQNLWKHINAHDDDTTRWSSDVLLRCAGIGDEKWASWLTSALCFMEFNGVIRTTEAGALYKLPINNLPLAQALARKVKGARVKDNHVIYDVGPGDRDEHNLFTRGGCCDYVMPQQTIVIKRLEDRMTFGEDEVADKLSRAAHDLALIGDFAKAKDKRRFVERVFAK